MVFDKYLSVVILPRRRDTQPFHSYRSISSFIYVAIFVGTQLSLLKYLNLSSLGRYSLCLPSGKTFLGEKFEYGDFKNPSFVEVAPKC